MDLSMTIPWAPRDEGDARVVPDQQAAVCHRRHALSGGVLRCCRLHREALAEALGELVDRGTTSEAEAESAGRQVLAENARRLYRLA
jgi:hypothetical protein